MIEWVIIAVLAYALSLLLIDVLNKKKTEIDGAHTVVSFDTFFANFDGNSGNVNRKIAKVLYYH